MEKSLEMLEKDKVGCDNNGWDFSDDENEIFIDECKQDQCIANNGETMGMEEFRDHETDGAKNDESLSDNAKAIGEQKESLRDSEIGKISIIQENTNNRKRKRIFSRRNDS